MVSPSKWSMRPTRGSPNSVMILMVSNASNMPKIPAVGPRMGNFSISGGIFGRMHCKQGPLPGRMVVICPYREWTPAWTKGTFSLTQASFSTNRVRQLSMQSTTTVKPWMSSLTLFGVIILGTASISTSGFSW